jgi:hypothetical protein
VSPQLLDGEVVHVSDLSEEEITKLPQHVDTRQWADVLGMSSY